MMKRIAFLFLIVNVLVPSGRAADVPPAAQWPLTDSLENEVSALKLDPYSDGSKLSADAMSYQDGAATLGDVTLFGTPMLDVSAGITVTGWVKPNTLEEGFTKSAPHTLIYFYDSTDRGKTQFVFRILDGKLNAFNATPAKNIFSSFATPVDEWSFFAFVLKSDSLDIYLNHYPPQTTAINCSYQYDRIYIGAMSTGLARPYRGLMKHVRLYSGALDADDVQKIYKAESGQ
jgi:hypothetical protein